MSYYCLSDQGVMDFGKFAQDKIKTKKEPADIESKRNATHPYHTTHNLLIL